MKNAVPLLAALCLVLALGACSRSEVTFVAVEDEGGSLEANAVLKLDDFNDARSPEGKGTLTVEAVPGRTRTAPVGRFAATWKRTDGHARVRSFTVSVPATGSHLGFEEGSGTTRNVLIAGAPVFRCTSCDGNAGGVGDLRSLPGLFLKQK